MKRIRVFLPVTILLIVALGMRMLYARHHPAITVTADSFEYYSLAKKFATAPQLNLLVNPYRQPLYPLFILASIALTGGTGDIESWKSFSTATGLLAVIQSLVSVGAIIVLYRTLVRHRLLGRGPFIIGLLLSGNMLLIPWERALLTESISIALVTLMVSVFIDTWVQPRPRPILLLLVLGLLAAILRPALMVIPALAFILLLLKLKNTRLVGYSARALVVFLVFPIVYAAGNAWMWGYNGFSVIGEFNLLGRILTLQLPIEAGSGVPYFYDTMTSYRTKGRELNPYRYLDAVDPDIYAKTDRLNQLATFTHRVIAANTGTYLSGSFRDIPGAIAGVSPFILEPRGSVFAWLQRFSTALGAITLASVLFLPISLLRLMRLPHGPHSIETVFDGLGLVAWAHIGASVLLGYEDFGRLAAPSVPLLLLYTACWVRRAYPPTTS
ncbi:hypothetical protein HY411_01115 [Candidatus Gottesmanbacteria bacterium]|nr:hypothetical protein [Candidatus Gottesmanbacteria bacterium]